MTRLDNIETPDGVVYRIVDETARESIDALETAVAQKVDQSAVDMIQQTVVKWDDTITEYTDTVKEAVANINALSEDVSAAVEHMDTTLTTYDTELASKAPQTGLDATNEAVSENQQSITDLKAQVKTLIGSDVDKSVRTIANEELTEQLIPENAKESLDTLKEIAAWIQEHPDDASAMSKQIEANEAAIEAVRGEIPTVDKTYSASSANPQAGTAVAEAITGVTGGAAGAGDNKSLALGSGAVAGTDSSLALGSSAKVTGAASIALGSSASASGSSAVAVGAGANAAGSSPTVALGNGATVIGLNAVAVGYGANAPAPNSVALGDSSTTSAEYTVSVGNSTNMRRIMNVSNPKAEHDAATKQYVDTYLEELACLLASTEFTVAAGSWSSSTATIDGTAYYTYEIGCTIYDNNPEISLAASGTLPTSAEQSAYECVKYAVANAGAKTLILYAETVPECDFVIRVRGVRKGETA